MTPQMFLTPKVNHKVYMLIWTITVRLHKTAALAVSVALLTRDKHERSIKEGKCYWLKSNKNAKKTYNHLNKYKLLQKCWSYKLFSKRISFHH